MKIIMLFIASLLSMASVASTEKIETVNPYHRLHISGEIHVVLKQGDENTIVLKGNKEALEQVIIKQQKGKLHISKNYRNDDQYKDEKIKLVVYQSQLSEVKISGASTFKGKLAKGEAIDFSLSGASQAKVNIEAEDINVKIAGASELALVGESAKATIKCVGASMLDAKEFKTTTADVSAVGASHITLHVEEALSVNAVGASSVSYHGDASVKKRTVGASSVQKI